MWKLSVGKTLFLAGAFAMGACSDDNNNGNNNNNDNCPAPVQGVQLTVEGEVWDTDSRGFASFGGLSSAERELTAARRGSRVSVLGQPGDFTYAGAGPAPFSLTFEAMESSFRMIAEGDRFPLVITQPIDVPDDTSVPLNIKRINSARAEGPEHTWPLSTAASNLGYASTYEMLDDNRAALRLLAFGSGEAGAPSLAENSTISVTGASTDDFPFVMDADDTTFATSQSPIGAFIVIVSFDAADDMDKDVTVQITDTVTDTTLNPPRPWTFAPATFTVRNGYATSVSVSPES